MVRLVDVLAKDLALSSRWTAAKEQAPSCALGKFKDDRALEPLIQALKDEDSWVRDSAFKALQSLAAMEAT